MTKAYRYHRFSTPEQDQGSSLIRQRDATLKLCEKHKWEQAEVIEDKGLSAWSGDHLASGGLGRFKARVDGGYIEPGSILVIENLDRLSREKLKKARRWIEDINEQGITVAVCSPELLLDEEAMSGSNMAATVMYLMEANRSRGESDRKSEMLLIAQEKRMENARKQIVYTARMPQWLEGERNGRFRIIEERAALIRDMFEWCASGMGYTAIAQLLNNTVTPWSKPRSKSTALWRESYIRQIIQGPAVEGEYHRRTGRNRAATGEVINYYPRIVPVELVARARAAVKNRNRGGPRHKEARNLFTGRIKCGHCGDAMVRVMSRVKGKEYQHLKCIRYNTGGAYVEGDSDANNARRCVNSVYYKYDAFERAALEQMLHLALDSTYFVQPDLTAPLVVSVAQLTKDLEVLETKRARWLAWVEEDDEAEEAKAKLRELRPQIAQVRSQLEAEQDALERARGNVSADEHLKRVLEVREAIYSDDSEEREAARRKVQDAVYAMVSVVTCQRSYIEGQRQPVREIHMALSGGHVAYSFDNDGNVTRTVSVQGIPDMMRGTASAASADAATAIEHRIRQQGVKPR